MGVPYEKRATDFTFHDGERGKNSLACPAHFHPHIEFFYLEQGKMICQIDADSYEVEAGDFLIAFPHQVHAFEDGQDKPGVHMLFIVHPDIMPELAGIFSKRQPECAVVKHLDRHPDMIELLHRMGETSRTKHPYRDTILKGLLLTFFGKLLSMVKLSEPHNEETHALREVVNYCSFHFQTDLSLERLERDLHLSRYYISHLFSHRLNIRFNDYVNSLRISEACRLLRKTDMSITDICARVGFNTLRTFNRSFMKQMRLSPSEYRANCRDEQSEAVNQEGESDPCNPGMPVAMKSK